MNHDTLALLLCFFEHDVLTSGFVFVHDIFSCLGSFWKNVDLSADGGSSGRLVSGDHDYLDACFSTSHDSGRDSDLGWIDEGNESQECELSYWEIKFLRSGGIKFVIWTKFSWKNKLGKAEHSFSLLSKNLIDLLEIFSNSLIDHLLLALAQ